MSTIDNRYHVGCSCCGLVSAEQRKRRAINAMIDHMGEHKEDQTFSVYDSMHRGGPRVVYSGRIHAGVKSHWSGVPVENTAATAEAK